MIDPEGNVVSEEEIISKDGYNDKFYDNTSFTFDNDVKVIAIASDGIGSFIKTEEDGRAKNISIKEMIEPFVSYKNFKGNFVERRLKRMQRNNIKNGITHYDDVSVAAIHLQ